MKQIQNVSSSEFKKESRDASPLKGQQKKEDEVGRQLLWWVGGMGEKWSCFDPRWPMIMIYFDLIGSVAEKIPQD